MIPSSTRIATAHSISKSISHPKIYQWVEVPVRGRLSTDSPEGDDTFPPAIASYEVIDGWLVYRGRDGSEGVIVGPRASLLKWMADVDALVSKYPLPTQVPWDPKLHGGEANVKACLHAAKEVLQKFGLPLRYTIMVSTDPMASSAPGHREIQFVNVHLNNTADFLGGVTVPYCESCGAHEASHLGFSARNDRGRAVLDVLKERQRKGLPYLSTYHAMGGHLEGTAEAGAFYTLKPAVLLREAPEVHAAVAWWFGDAVQ